MRSKKWYDYMWIWAIVYFSVSFFNILFAWLGMIDFLIPVIVAVVGGNKWFCNNMCGRGQLFRILGRNCKLSRNKPIPKGLGSKGFRYGFMVFFFIMFGNMVYQTYLVAAGAKSLRQVVKLFWTFKVPFRWAYTAGSAPDWAAQYSFGLYSLMVTSTLIGLIVMLLYKPRTWCSFCPMGTLTQGVCKRKEK